MRRYLLAAAFLLLLPITARAQVDGPVVLPGVEGWEGPGSWRVSGGVLWGSAVALDEGMPFGFGVEGLRRVGTSPFLFGARLSFTRATEASTAWVVRHDHPAASLLARVEGSRGPGLVYAQLGAGAMAVIERAQRHQFERLKGLGLDNLEEHAWSMGPWTSLEVGVAVRVRGGLSATIGGGPTLAAQQVTGQWRWRVGFQTMLGVSHAF